MSRGEEAGADGITRLGAASPGSAGFADRWARLLAEQPPPVVRRLVKDTGQGMMRHQMLTGGERILLSVSGGKDSLALVLSLVLRRRFVPIDYSLEAVMINWREHPHTAEAITRIREYHEALGVPLTVIDADMRPESFGGRFDCYRCGRNRRRILFDVVRGWTEAGYKGVPLIATGHHLDDVVQTTLMNLTLRGTFATMRPVQPFFGGSVKVIRPLCEVGEETIRAVATAVDLPISTIGCPFRTTNIRSRVAPIVAQLEALSPGARRRINRAHTSIDFDYLPDQGLYR